MTRQCTSRTALHAVAIIALVALLCCHAALAQIKYHPPADEVPEGPMPEQGSWGVLAVGGLGHDVQGNRQRFEQYYTQPLSAHPSLLVENLSRGGEILSAIDLQNIGEPGRSVNVAVANMKSLVTFESAWRHDEFFESFGPGASRMTRNDFDAQLTLPVTSELDIDVVSGFVGLDGPSNMAPVDWEAFGFGGRAYWSGDSIAVDAQYNGDSFRQAGGAEVSGMDRVVTLAVGPARNHRHMVEAHASLQNTQLEGFSADFERKLAGVTVTSELTPALTFRGSFQTSDIDETITQNAYAAGRDEGRASLLFNGSSKSRVEAGVDVADTDYVGRFQTRIEEPQTTTFWVKANYRPLDRVRLRGSIVRRDIENTPVRSSQTGGPPVGPLVTLDESERINISGSYDASDRAGVTGDFRQDEWTLAGAGVDATMETTSITAWLLPCDRLTVTGSFLNMDWNLAGVDGGGAAAPAYVTKVNAYSVSAALQIGGDSSLDGTFSHAFGFGAVPTRDNTLTLDWRRRLCDTADVGLTFTWQDFDEVAPGTDNSFEAILIGGSVVHSF